MGAGFEIIEEPTFGAGGSFVPKADQKQFRSAWACIEGEKQLGWEDEHSMTQGLTSADGRAKLVFEAHKDAQGKYNDVKYKGMRLREFRTPIEAAQRKDRHDAGLSANEVQKVTHPISIPASANQVGRSLMGENSLIPPAAASFSR